MNIIHYDNRIGRTQALGNKVDIAINSTEDNQGVIVILSAADFDDPYLGTVRLRGYNINGVIIPKELKNTFKSTELFKIIAPTFIRNKYFISYY